MAPQNSDAPTHSPSAEELDAEFSSLSYEEARGQLVDIVSRLEQGNIPLEESLDLWERGEALARRCEAWLDGARERLRLAQQRVSAQDAVHVPEPSSSDAK